MTSNDVKWLVSTWSLKSETFSWLVICRTSREYVINWRVVCHLLPWHVCVCIYMANGFSFIFSTDTIVNYTILHKPMDVLFLIHLLGSTHSDHWWSSSKPLGTVTLSTDPSSCQIFPIESGQNGWVTTNHQLPSWSSSTLSMDDQWNAFIVWRKPISQWAVSKCVPTIGN